MYPMRYFIERNKPIFIIGLITFLIFIALIIIYNLIPHIAPGLVKTGNESTYNTTLEESPTIPGSKTSQGGVSTETAIDEKYGAINIEFVNGGWKTKLAFAVRGQAIVWKNNSDATIYLRQKTPTYPELDTPTPIKPVETFTFRLTKIGEWSFDEEKSKSFGTIRVKELEL